MRNLVHRQYFVYILSNKYHTVFYTGITNDLIRRVFEHRSKLVDGFTKKYNVNKLLYYEMYQDSLAAIMREKQIKDYRREKKVELVNGFNPLWKDLWEEISPR